LTAKEGIELVLCTRKKETIDMVKKKYRINEGYTDIKKLIDSGIDCAMIHSSTNSHFEFAKILLEHKIPIYIDKPISYSYEDALQLNEISKKYNTRIMVGFNRRFAPKVKELKEVGNPDIIIMQKNRFNLPDINERVFIVDDFIHVIDTIRFLMEKEYDTLDVKYKKDERGLLNIILTLSNEMTTAIAIMNRDNGITEEHIEYMSSGKKIYVDSLVKVTKLEANNKQIEEFGDWVSTLYKRGFEGIINEFISSIEEDRESCISFEDSLATHKLCEDLIEIIKKTT
ncbi:MAG: Gfo/Idh/MocA family protein, partial [Sarcina sp.]